LSARGGEAGALEEGAREKQYHADRRVSMPCGTDGTAQNILVALVAAAGLCIWPIEGQCRNLPKSYLALPR
jgi:hypothetical protein